MEHSTFNYIKEQINLLDNSQEFMDNALNKDDMVLFNQFKFNYQSQCNFCEELILTHEESLTMDEYDFLMDLYESKTKQIN